MINCYTVSANAPTPIYAFTKETLALWLSTQSAFIQQYWQSQVPTPKAGTVCLIPDLQGKTLSVILLIANDKDFWSFGVLSQRLAPGTYALQLQGDAAYQQRAELAFGLGAYRFTRYKKAEISAVLLHIPEEKRCVSLTHWLEAIYWGRDLINTPALDLNPETLAEAAVNLANTFAGQAKVIVGEALLSENYPAIYEVGKASSIAPRLIDLRFGQEHAVKLTLVGKGVCFDTGGLDLKPALGMRYMKKDMGGAAHVLALAHLLLSEKLPIQLRVLIPAVENSISGDCLHPGDVINTRQGLRIEIDNTDAEGRLVLCDALAEAVSETPDLLIDMATLTGAARVALGPDIPVFFSNQAKLAEDFRQVAKSIDDPVWELPLYAPYQDYLKSDIADFSNASKSPYAGAITGALYLQLFVPDTIPWLHFDVMAYNEVSRPGRPIGGEIMAISALYHYICRWLIVKK